MKHFCGVGFGNVCSDPMFMYVISTTVAIGADVYLSTNILNRLNTNGLVQLSSSEGLVSGTMWSYWIGSIGKALLEIWVSFGILKIALLWRRRVVRNNNSLYFKDTAVYVANNLLPKKLPDQTLQQEERSGQHVYTPDDVPLQKKPSAAASIEGGNGNNYSYSLHIYHPKNHITEYYD